MKTAEYRKTATVQAKLFEKGDEDGFTEPLEHYFNPTPIPYISTLENQKHNGVFGMYYVCTGINGERWLVEKSIFEATYEPVSEHSHPSTPDEWVETVIEIIRNSYTGHDVYEYIEFENIRTALQSVSLPEKKGVDKPEVTFIDYAPGIKSMMLVKDCKCQCGDKRIGETVAWVCNICAGYVGEYKSI